ncbi:MAG: oxygen-dependent coproporphyrinogen oxidase [Chitinophagales bacterium]
MNGTREKFTRFIHALQDEICAGLEAEDTKAKFMEDSWERPGGGGGKTRVISGGEVFEKGGVNTSIVHGDLPEAMQKAFKVEAGKFFACGISLVIHPVNPFVPTTHANYRYFELYDEKGNEIDSWFGGGADLTPYYLVNEDAIHFHKTLKKACDTIDDNYYPQFKKDCDKYFWNAHRNEARGVGGIFYDYLRADEKLDKAHYFNFSKAAGNAFLPAYLPLVQKHKDFAYTDANKEWQEIRRGRYVEFNLIHDRGTLFGLKTNGRIESILMSLPPVVRWEYQHKPAQGSPEFLLEERLKNPVDWV